MTGPTGPLDEIDWEPIRLAQEVAADRGVPISDATGARLSRPVPALPEIVPGSQPVVAFGNPHLADVATLSINPSRIEFHTPAGQPLRDADARLLMSDGGFGHFREVLAAYGACLSYFGRNPYRRWSTSSNGQPSPRLTAHTTTRPRAISTWCSGRRTPYGAASLTARGATRTSRRMLRSWPTSWTSTTSMSCCITGRRSSSRCEPPAWSSSRRSAASRSASRDAVPTSSAGVAVALSCWVGGCSSSTRR